MAINMTVMQLMGAEIALLVGTRDWFDYKSGSKGEKLGTTYVVLNLSDASLVSVKVPGEYPIMAQAEITARNQSRDFVWVKFQNFTARPYVGKSGRMEISAKADDISILQNKEMK